MGKTVLLADAAGRARSEGMSVLSVTMRESEAKLAFPRLHQPLRPVLSRAAALPGRQAQALRGALGLAEEPVAGDPLLTGVAVLTLLSDLSERPPVLVGADDAHWLDRSSPDALAFAASRPDAERVVVLVGARGPSSQLEAPLGPRVGRRRPGHQRAGPSTPRRPPGWSDGCSSARALASPLPCRRFRRPRGTARRPGLSAATVAVPRQVRGTFAVALQRMIAAPALNGFYLSGARHWPRRCLARLICCGAASRSRPAMSRWSPVPVRWPSSSRRRLRPCRL
jgi:hypothetical protein